MLDVLFRKVFIGMMHRVVDFTEGFLCGSFLGHINFNVPILLAALKELLKFVNFRGIFSSCFLFSF